MDAALHPWQPIGDVARRIAGFGPWRDGLSAAERLARLRSMRAIILLIAPTCEAVDDLRAAETDVLMLDAARASFDRIPSLQRRRILSVMARLHEPVRP
jgi:hypothetical protein